ncbi:Tetratricopeptide repeat-containing protein [Colwellia chukchiensis]|uniref:Tetratricopeptide repeat-containing protein n=1 Tax=Colwellia chukchiensis TaxID=641665 RepID=A0A1H7TLH3_9GAMM|nr:tetratricopeptide repeat-containing sulfotransferase family protein [Colwellia chukchiensis]SEL85186.1 Tetratricopeptide repeat-containing protein [Colwellia chukchiensis]
MNKAAPATTEAQLKSIQQLIQSAKFDAAIKQGQQLQQHALTRHQNVELWYLLAVAQRYGQHLPSAQASLTALLKLDATHARAYQEQGYLHLAQNKPSQAQQAFEQAVQLNPSLVASWQELIELYRVAKQQSGIQKAANQLAKLKKLPPALLAVTELMHDQKWQKAELICRNFLQQNKQHIDGMCLLAEIGIELKVYDDAEFLLASALALSPTHIQARSHYLNLLIRLGKYKSALIQVDNLLQRQANNLSFLVAKANTLTGLGEVSQAITIFEYVIAQASPNTVPATQLAAFHLQLGHALKAQGEIKKAVLAYQKAYQINPSYGDAFWSLANTKTYRFSEQEIAHMQAQQNSKTLALTDKVQLYFATGKAFEDNKQYKRAFLAYQQGNLLQHQHNGFDINKIEQQVDEQIQYCTPELFAERGNLGYPSPAPIFIVGLPRAGSTLLEQILASHSQVDGTMELHNILGLAARLRGRNQAQKPSQYPKILQELAPSYFHRFGQQFIEETQVYRAGGAFFIDKMPNNFLHIGLIRLILPNAKIIDARRSAMACCFSGYKQLFAEGQEFSYDLEDIGRYYQAYLKLMAHWQSVLPGFILTVKHEDVVDDLATQVRRMLDFCGLAFEQSCLDFHKTKRNIKTPSSEQVRQPIYKSATEQWRHFEAHLTPLKKVLTMD